MRIFQLGLLLIWAVASDASPPKLVPWRLDVRVYSGKSDRISKREQYDDRAVRMDFKVEVTNQEYKQTLENAKATFIAFAKHVNQSDELKVVLRQEFGFTLEPLKKHVQDTTQVKFEYDDKDYGQFGYKYLGYVLVVYNAKGEMIAVRGTPPMFADNLDKVLGLKTGAFIRRDFTLSQGVQ